MKSLSVGILAAILWSGGAVFAECPSADLSGDCFVDFEDFALMANQWLTTDPCVPDDMTYIPDGEFDMGDHFSEGGPDELPVHAVLVDAFFVSQYEVTNQQDCVVRGKTIRPTLGPEQSRSVPCASTVHGTSLCTANRPYFAV